MEIMGKISVWSMTDGSLVRTLDTGDTGLWCLAACHERPLCRQR